MSPKNSIQEQLMLLRNLTRTTGVLHDAQLFQLKIWANLTFSLPCVISIGTDDKTVDFMIDHADTFREDEFRLPLGSSLDHSVKALFGDDWNITVTDGHNRSVVFVSAPRIPASNPSNRDDPREE